MKVRQQNTAVVVDLIWLEKSDESMDTCIYRAKRLRNIIYINEQPKTRYNNPDLRINVQYTICTSESELILSTYMVTPTSTGGPASLQF